MATTQEISKTEKKLNIARGVFGTLAAIFALITFITFGANMDAANFPGATLKLDEYTAEENADKEGQLKQIFGGYQIETVGDMGCTSFVESTEDAAGASAPDFANVPVANQFVCKAGTEDTVKNQNTEWTDGWLVAPDCKRTSDENECAPFGANSPLAWFGFLTFGTLSIQVVLFGVHTIYAVMKDALKGTVLTRGNALSTLKGFSNTEKSLIALTIVWLIVGFALMVTSAFAWDSMCDKIDTGLGRRVSDSAGTLKRACATSTCTMSFGSFFATMTFALTWYRIPHILEWFGVLESA
ncbi:hypothetical protein N9A45_01685 [bacterium]|nr:hypothetical protein [bacterium]